MQLNSVQTKFSPSGVGGNRNIELLSPARNLACGLAAVNHGADAVYIGAPKFSARSVAGNSIEDIAQLAKYAHKFNGRVYAAINTLLYDNELEEAQRIIWQLYEAGTDALIIQDMGILQMDLPPIALHASTQTDNRTLEKVQFLENVGFSQVVLARELSLQAIKKIASATSVALEFFVHGALCVSYSGQCYISEAMCGRSANRGECAQYCRLPYDLLDDKGNVLIKNKHLLSLKDMNLSQQLSDLLEAGITSFKIEGRLKEVDYVKNVTAYYRRELDAILETSSKYQKSSSGKTTFFFTPNVEKTFHRGSTTYFVNGRNSDISSFDTPKSVGERIGEITRVSSNFFEINTSVELHNGDGLCYLDTQGNFNGFRINRIEGNRVFPFERMLLNAGTILYRNYDIVFDRQLSKKTSERKIAVKLCFMETRTGFALQAVDEDGNEVIANIQTEKISAKDEQQALDNLYTQLNKWGGSDYIVVVVENSCKNTYFIPTSLLAKCRRDCIDLLDAERYKAYKPIGKKITPTTYPYPQKSLSYLGNVSNHLAEAFYQQHGVIDIAPRFDKTPQKNVPLMQMKHCLRYSLGKCPRIEKGESKISGEPLILVCGKNQFVLEFDCVACETTLNYKS
jgi:putative protease